MLSGTDAVCVTTALVYWFRRANSAERNI